MGLQEARVDCWVNPRGRDRQFELCDEGGRDPTPNIAVQTTGTEHLDPGSRRQRVLHRQCPKGVQPSDEILAKNTANKSRVLTRSVRRGTGRRSWRRNAGVYSIRRSQRRPVHKGTWSGGVSKGLDHDWNGLKRLNPTCSNAAFRLSPAVMLRS